MRRNLVRTLCFLLVAGGGLFAGSATSFAFPYPYLFHTPANDVHPGGGGRYGTGGAADSGIHCSLCHITRIGIDPPSSVTAVMDVVPAFGDVGGERGYTPGTTYHFTIRQVGSDRLDPMTSQSFNGMAVTIEDGAGHLSGRFAPDGIAMPTCPIMPPYPANDPAVAVPPVTGRTTYMYGDCHAVLAFPVVNATAWRFDWTSPPAGAGTLTLWLSLVDGDQAGVSSLGDDTFERSYPLHEM